MPWIFDKADRLAALLARAREAETYLLRERCDATADRAAVARIDRRRVIVAGRIRVLSRAARVARYVAHSLS